MDLGGTKDSRYARLRESFFGVRRPYLGVKDRDATIYLFDSLSEAMAIVKKAFSSLSERDFKIKLCVIEELAFGLEALDPCDGWLDIRRISMGQVPQAICPSFKELGVFFPCLYEDQATRFGDIEAAHGFQVLRESTKPTPAHRKGIYMTPVAREGEDLRFRLLRCSTNLEGPTDSLRAPDLGILDDLNARVPGLFAKPMAFNHVLAQIYYNKKEEGKDRKARIGDHSDKTKDMPSTGLMAFVTLYRDDEIFRSLVPKPEVGGPYDLFYKKATALTRLRFRRKKGLTDSTGLPPTFEVPLYPGSVFMIALDTNRLYTHEIVPSNLPVEHLPTRMGYVVRCSDQEALWKRSEDQVYLVDKKDGTRLYPLSPPTPCKEEALKEAYRMENRLTDRVCYGEVDFSFNQGDYLKPIE